MTSLDKPTLLVVDDSRTVRASLSKMLKDQFTIINAEDGEDGWTKLRENPEIQLVISDIMMPNLDGYGFICRIRGASAKVLNKMPIVVITSKEDVLTRERAHACGANNFIVKPVASSDLIETVKFHTEHSLTTSGQENAPEMEKYGQNVENAVLETPDFAKALEIIENADKETLEPYAIELAIRCLPLLEFCNKAFDMDAGSELNQLKSKLKSA